MSVKLEKLLTKNLGISVLAGISIMGGAFWWRISGYSDNKSVATNNPPQQSDTETVDPETLLSQELNGKNNDPTIRVADLPNVNGLANTAENRQLAASLSPEEFATLKFINTPSGSTEAYADISDKAILYPDGVEQYLPKNITSRISTNRATLLTYGTDLAKILNGYPFYTKQNPAEIAYNIYKNSKADSSSGDKAGIAELDAIKSTYEATVKRLLSQTVPGEVLELHLQLINTADRISQLIKNMGGIKSDQLLALNSARQYIEEAEFMIETIGQISYYLKDKNIALGKENMLRLGVDVIN